MRVNASSSLAPRALTEIRVRLENRAISRHSLCTDYFGPPLRRSTAFCGSRMSYGSIGYRDVGVRIFETKSSVDSDEDFKWIIVFCVIF